MQQLDTLITAAKMLGNIQQGKPYKEVKPTGLINSAETHAPPVIVNLFNQCRRDVAMLANSDALVTLYEIGEGKSFVTESYWKRAAAFRQTLESLENLLTPLPTTPSEVKAKLDNFTTILKDSDTHAKAVVESMLDIQAECDLMQARAEKLSGGYHASTCSVN